MQYGFDAAAKRVIVHIDSSDNYENRLLQWEALFKDQRWEAGYVIIISTTGPYIPPKNISSMITLIKMIKKNGAEKVAFVTNDTLAHIVGEEWIKLATDFKLSAQAFENLQDMLDWINA